MAGSEREYGGYRTAMGYGESPSGWRRAVPARAFRRGPKGYRRSDQRLLEDICETIGSAGHVDASEVTVDVQEGHVRLEGTVPARCMKHAIEDLADTCPGVQDIDNRIRVRV